MKTLLAIAVLIVCAGCRPSLDPTLGSKGPTVIENASVYEDTVRGVACYRYPGYALSCVKVR